MNPTTPHNTIKPLLPHTIHIKSLYTYQNYLIKRPKHTQTFKVSRQGILLIKGGHESQTKAELKLKKALSLLKSVKEVDLRGFQVKGENLNRNRFQSCFKQSSIYRILTFHWTRRQLCNNLGANFAETPLKDLPKLHSLAYELTSMAMLKRDSRKDPCKKDPLRYLKCCPKVESLEIGTSGTDYDFSKIFVGLHKYSTSVKHLVLYLYNKDGNEGSALHLENLVKLESACLNFVGNSLIWKIDGLSDLPRLQEMSLEFHYNILPGIDLMLRRMAERKILKKIRLIFPESVPTDQEILKALQDFDQLTHFELNTSIQDEMLEIISKCIEKMKQLHDLRLTISRQFAFESYDSLKVICQNINALQFLRHLHLSFLPLMALRVIPNFILYCRPIQLETLSLISPQPDPVQALLDLAAVLKTTSSSLRKLTVSFGSFSPDQHSQPLILRFISSLSNIRTLEIVGLDVTHDNLLYQVVKAINSLEYLRELVLGGIKEQVTPSAYENALIEILSKRGLERFECQTPDSLLESCGLLAGLFRGSNSCQINMKMIERKNPFLESLNISDHLFVADLLREVVCWP